MQYKINADQIDSFDEDALSSLDSGNNNGLEDRELQLEWRFTTHCIEILAKISEVIPSEVFGLLSDMFSSNLSVYLELPKIIEQKHVLTLEEVDKIHWCLKDFVTSIQSIGRISANFTHEFFAPRYFVTKAMLEKLTETLKYTSSNITLFYGDKNKVINQDILVLIHSELIASLRSYSYWFMQASSSNEEHQADFTRMVTSIVDECVGIVTFSSQSSCFPGQVTRSALVALSSIHDTIRCQLFLSLPTIHSLVKLTVSSVWTGEDSNSNHCLLSIGLTRQDELALLTFISKMLLLPWAHVSDAGQDWSSRCLHHNHVVNALFFPVKKNAISHQQCNGASAESNVMMSRLKIAIKKSLPVVTAMVEGHSESTTRSKTLLLTSLEEDVLPLCIQLLNHFLAPDSSQDDVGEELLSFFVSLFNVLRSQVKKQVIEQVICIILRVYSAPSCTASLLNGSRNRGRILENLLKLLTFIVQQPVYSFKPHSASNSLIPDILSLVLNQVSPQISLDQLPNQTECNQIQSSDPEVLHALFDFYHEFLNNNFKYFFGGRPSPPTLGSLVDHESEFVKIMEWYGRSFVSYKTDIQVYRKNLNSLQALNQKFNLFHKDCFRTNLLKDFLTLFLRTFVSKTHELFHDELTSIIFELASVDMNSFHSDFLREFVSSLMSPGNNSLVVKELVPARDLPSFSLNLQRFSSDLRFSQMQSTSAHHNNSQVIPP